MISKPFSASEYVKQNVCVCTITMTSAASPADELFSPEQL